MTYYYLDCDSEVVRWRTFNRKRTGYGSHNLFWYLTHAAKVYASPGLYIKVLVF